MGDRGPLPSSSEGSWIHPNKNEDLSKIPEIKSSSKSNKKVRFDEDSVISFNLESDKKSNKKKKTQRGGKERTRRTNRKTIKKRKYSK